MRLLHQAAAWTLVVALASSAAPPVASAQTVDLGSAYLTEALELDGATARGVGLKGELGGRAVLTLDPNACSLNLFGDPMICTQIAVFPRVVQLLEVEVADPLGLGRKLYELQGLKGPESTYLVVPRTSEGSFSLVQTDETGAVARVVPLH